MIENTYNFFKGAKLHLCCSNDDFRVPEKEDEQVPKTFNTGLNIKSLKRLADAVSSEFVDFRYTSRHGAIEVIFSPIYDIKAIIMPRIPQCEQ